MTSQRYEIRDNATGQALLADATPAKVSRYFSKHKIRTVREQKIDGVIVIYVVPA